MIHSPCWAWNRNVKLNHQDPEPCHTFTSTLRHPAHSYTKAGVYTVSLQVSGPDGSDDLTRVGYITVAEWKVYLPLIIKSY
jgi:PKD repeat protein